ncbi:hypothetical protein DIPPA_24579 [Diplonema papillatum]|nr:hypothetical protein DIPPA_24579 [Diplonema papillatum]
MHASVPAQLEAHKKSASGSPVAQVEAVTSGDDELMSCESDDFAWFAEEKRDLQRYMDALEPEQLQASGAESGAREEEQCIDGEPVDRSVNRPERLLGKSKRYGMKYCLVKWINYDKPTWEPEEDLIEEGHGWLLAKKVGSRTQQVVKRVPRSPGRMFYPLATTAAPAPRRIRSGGDQLGMSFDKHNRTLSKKQLKAAPCSAKQAYKAGLLLQHSQ